MLRKLIFSDLDNPSLGHNVVCHQWKNVKYLWNNTLDARSEAIGIERCVKLFLILSQFIMPGLYIRAVFGSFGKLNKHIGVELYVIFKLVLAFFVLKYQLFNSITICGRHIVILGVWWMIFETMLYTANLVFCSEVFAKPHSYKRNIILIFIDYIQITIDYGSIYLFYGVLKQSGTNNIVKSSLDAGYFSFISSLTIGFGDIVPYNDFGKELIIGHILIFLLFGVLFINFYTSRIENVTAN